MKPSANKNWKIWKEKIKWVNTKQTFEIYEIEFFMLIPHLLPLAIHISASQSTVSFQDLERNHCFLKEFTDVLKRQRFRKLWRKTNGTDPKKDWTVSFYSSESIVLGEEKAELSTGSMFLKTHFGKKLSFPQKIFLAMASKTLYWRGHIFTSTLIPQLSSSHYLWKKNFLWA